MKLFKIIFSSVGLLFLIIGISFFLDTRSFLEEAFIANGTVVDLVESYSSDSTTYKPVVEFKTINNQFITFTSSTGSNPPSYHIGEVVDVVYEQNFPNDAKIRSFFTLWGLATVLFSMGLVFFSIGFIPFLLDIFRGKRAEELKVNGVKVNANVEQVKYISNYTMNGVSPYKIIATWQHPETSHVYTFKSQNIWYDPTSYIENNSVNVYIDETKPNKYYMDLGFLPK